jgi:pimeloyl-ACP methyl ester carboxylesterase
MLDAIQSFFSLHWAPQKPRYRPLPDHIKRQFVSSQRGDLELLISSPKNPDPASPALFFVHGGYGSAGVWLEWMNYLHEDGYGGNLYAYSARNHGASYTLCYPTMVYRTPLDAIASDLKSCFDFVESQHHSQHGSSNTVFISHSAGGGLTQYALANNLVRCRALCLLDAVPHFGMLPVYWNWACQDPWFMLRSLFHFQHPSSPLSSPKLVHGRFFGSQYPISSVPEFMKWMPDYESMGWPMGQMGGFWAWLRGRSQWLDIQAIVRNISNANTAERKDAVCVMVGNQDVLVDVEMSRQSAAEYREALGRKDEDQKRIAASESDSSFITAIDGTTVESAAGVQLVIVDGAGHHLQNDVQRGAGAEALLHFVRQC